MPGMDALPALLWDQHCCLPLSPEADASELARYTRPGGTMVLANVGYAPHSFAYVRSLLDAFRAGVAADERLLLASTTDDILAARDSGRVAVAFDLEDSGPLEGRLERVQELYDLGVRTMLPTYNRGNAAGSGCLDAVDDGLTKYGRELVREMNAVGMVVDGSHCSIGSGLDLCETSRQPVIYSHSCMRGLWEHPRNVTDDQARACADTGGVIGITGVGIFLGPNDASIDALVRHVDYAVELVGPEHVGLSTDFVFDDDGLDTGPEDDYLFDESFERWGPINFMPPERLLEVEDGLRGRGYPDEAISAILGGNFLRVAQQVWKGPRRRRSDDQVVVGLGSSRRGERIGSEARAKPWSRA
jgi:membrane dipeptidase